MTKCSKRIMDLCFTSIITLITTSCVNNIAEDSAEQGDIPIRISTEILCNNTRVTDEEFEKGDAIGLYVLIQPSHIDQKRYIDNEKLMCSDLSALVPENTLYYPKDDEVKCEFISYYPYSEKGIPAQENSLKVSIQTNQSSDEALSSSDFMVASNKDITPSNNMVPLGFEHKLCKVQMVLNPLSGEDADAILHSNPEIILSGFHSNASYNFETGQFDSFSEAGSIHLYGTWNVENGDLVGKEANLIPEPLTENHRIVLKINSKSYNCPFPTNHALTSGNKNQITINYSSSEGILAQSFDYGIGKWTEGMKGETKPEENATNINLHDLTFKESNIYRVMNDGKQVAEICKEYLLADNINAQAVVAYPFKDGKADLTNGTVISFVTANYPIGGRVSWTPDNILTYTPGNNNPINYFYLTPQPAISFTVPASPLSVWLEKDMLTDIRGQEKIVYPIVKIGMQYWMAANLRAIKYTDGKNITNKNKSNTTSAGHYSGTFNNSKVIFYNITAMQTGKVVPTGWRLPDAADWTSLSKYLDNNASLLKEGVWRLNEKELLPPVHSLACFNGYAEGFFYYENKAHANANNMIGYWTRGKTEKEISDKYTYLFYNNNEIKNDGNTAKGALSVRCIRI